MQPPAWRWPAEWEPQSAILIAWPHAGTDWAQRLAAVERSYAALAVAITECQPLLICTADAQVQLRARAVLSAAGVPAQRVKYINVAYDDTWLRDSGPITLTDPAHGFRLNDYRFTGWGGKFGAAQDDALIAQLLRAQVFTQAEHQRIDWALEGGAIESDGQGSVLTTWRCLSQRHPQQSRDDISAQLCDSLAAERVLWLDYGYLQGDDTDAHIDTLARFAPNDAIVFQACDDRHDPHYAELAAMGNELAALRTAKQRPYRLHALPWARPILDDGRRLAASYANYLVINDAVLVPAYDDAADDEAADIIGAAHPQREVKQIPCRPLIWQNGSLHCLTMQLPAGLLA
ncbi:MAG: agmatine deiminase family protein [Xanthomonadales bacterium]|nr:agmatine deiminase family protein [Xanthomonadales bacterium]